MIIGMIVQVPTVSEFQAASQAVFFDDSDPANVGYLDGQEPRNILYRGKYAYNPPLAPDVFQSQVKAAVKVDRQHIQDAHDMAVAAHDYLPVGALIDANS